MSTPKTYEELVEDRRREWDAAQRKAAANLADLQASLAKMPDVKNAPEPDTPWGHKGIRCPCGSEGFIVTRWTTVNGMKHRAELACLGCKRVETWDWGEGRWLV